MFYVESFFVLFKSIASFLYVFVSLVCHGCDVTRTRYWPAIRNQRVAEKFRKNPIWSHCRVQKPDIVDRDFGVVAVSFAVGVIGWAQKGVM